MKILAVVLTWIGLVYAGYKFDSWLFELIIDEVPQTNWLGLIKIVVGVVLFALTAGIIFGLATTISFILSEVLGIKK